MSRLDVMQELLDLGFSDHWFPVTKKRFPKLHNLNETTVSSITAQQELILTKSIDLEKGEAGKHRHFGKGEVQAFKRIAVLGSGGFGQVDKVLSLVSYREYARKRVRRRAFFGANGASAAKDFMDEIEILKRLKHRHIVEFVGSYTDPTYLALIMCPIAEMDLGKYLDQATTKDFPTIRTYFGCLVAGLQYLHANNIRHKDIKPKNILVNDGSVLYTDFGVARDSASRGHSTTIGASNGTPRYWAPEVSLCHPRNSSSDIWSLGCVFLEMLTVLKSHTLNSMHDFYDKNGSQEPFININPKATTAFIEMLEGIRPESDNKPAGWIKEMLQIDRHSRPTAAALMEKIVSPNSHGYQNTEFCGVCCAGNDESSDVDSLDEQVFRDFI